MYAWENVFKQRILEARKGEHSKLDSFYYWIAVNYGTSMNSHYLAAAFIFIGYSMAGNALTSDIVFPAIMLLGQFSMSGGMILSSTIAFKVTYSVTRSRIEKILLLKKLMS